MTFEEAGASVGLKDGRGLDGDGDDSEQEFWISGILMTFEEEVREGLDDDREASKEEGGALGTGLKENAEVAEDKGDGLESAVEGLGRDTDGFKEYEGVWGDGFNEEVGDVRDTGDGLEEGISGINGCAFFEDSGSFGAWGDDLDEVWDAGDSSDACDGLEEVTSVVSDWGRYEEDALVAVWDEGGSQEEYVSGLWEGIRTYLLLLSKLLDTS